MPSWSDASCARAIGAGGGASRGASCACATGAGDENALVAFSLLHWLKPTHQPPSLQLQTQ